jgi:hypothetical protein
MGLPWILRFLFFTSTHRLLWVSTKNHWKTIEKAKLFSWKMQIIVDSYDYLLVYVTNVTFINIPYIYTFYRHSVTPASISTTKVYGTHLTNLFNHAVNDANNTLFSVLVKRKKNPKCQYSHAILIAMTLSWLFF